MRALAKSTHALYSGWPCCDMQVRYANNDQLLSLTGYVFPVSLLQWRMDALRSVWLACGTGELNGVTAPNADSGPAEVLDKALLLICEVLGRCA